MNCEETRRQLSLEPVGLVVPRSAAARAHLDVCPACRVFWDALVRVDQALATRPLAAPSPGFAEQVLRRVRLQVRHEVSPPFTRAFFAFSAALTLLALVSGALLLHFWSMAPVQGLSGLAALWLSPAWSRDASAWLSVEGERLAQVVLPVVVGMVVTLASAAAGFRAWTYRNEGDPAAHEETCRYR